MPNKRFLIDNIYIGICNHLFRQCVGYPHGYKLQPSLSQLVSGLYEVQFLRSVNKSNENLAKAVNLTSCHIDDLISINNPMFKQFLKDIYPAKLVVSETSDDEMLCHTSIY